MKKAVIVRVKRVSLHKENISDIVKRFDSIFESKYGKYKSVEFFEQDGDNLKEGKVTFRFNL